MTEARGRAPRVGVIGLGVIGGGMAGCLMRAGYPVSGFDVDDAALERFRVAGGIAKADAAEVAAAVDLVIMALRDERQIQSVLNAHSPFVYSLKKGTVLWVASTVSPDYIVGLGGSLTSHGVHLLDGPVSGGASCALEGKLTLIIAGCEEAAAMVASVAPAVAERVFRIGSAPGPASAVKIVNQLLTASHIALTAEALGFATRMGIDTTLLLDVVGASSGASRIFADRAPRMLVDDVAPGATLGIFIKDLEIALDCAQKVGATTPVACAAHDVFAKAAAAFGDQTGDPAVFRLYRRNALGYGGDDAIS